jgi:hypothetical protein
VSSISIEAFAALIVIATSNARADAPEPIPDVEIPFAPAPRRALALELQPLPLIAGLGKSAADIVVVPVDHHAIVVTALYTSTSTAPILLLDAAGAPIARLPEQMFRGAGIELGYRYYSGHAGPRGWFVGPSLIAVAMFEHQGRFGDGSQTDYLDYGVALDGGYQALVGDSVSIALGAGVQGLITSRPIPDQQFPARLYADSGVWPRLLLSIGWSP